MAGKKVSVGKSWVRNTLSRWDTKADVNSVLGEKRWKEGGFASPFVAVPLLSSPVPLY